MDKSKGLPKGVPQAPITISRPQGLVAQSVAANRFSQEAIRDGNNKRTQAHLQKLFENNDVPTARAKLLADRWKGATEVKFASEQALGRRDLTEEERRKVTDDIAMSDLAIFQVEDLARRNFVSTAALARPVRLAAPPPPDLES